MVLSREPITIDQRRCAFRFQIRTAFAAKCFEGGRDRFQLGLGAGSLADQPRDQSAGVTAGGTILADLQREHLNPRHLLVQELHQPLQAGGNLIGNEDQPDLAVPEVRPDRLPERIGSTAGFLPGGIQPRHQALGCSLRVVALKPGAQLPGGPER